METREEFIKKYGSYIARQVKGTGILAGTLVAQAILESSGLGNDGYSYVGASKLAREANNYFGIKCSSNWRGDRYNVNTGEYTSKGSFYIAPNACFKKYKSVKDSISDYIGTIKGNERYERAGVFEAKTVKAQAQAIKNAGYATDPNYVSKVDSVYQNIKPYIDKYAITIPDKVIETITGKDKTEYELSKKKNTKDRIIGVSLIFITVAVLTTGVVLQYMSKKK